MQNVVLTSQAFSDAEDENSIEIIDLDTIENFSSLINEMGNVTCRENTSGIKFKVEETTYNMIGFSPCPSSGEISCYFRVNDVFVKNDSIYKTMGRKKEIVPIENLGIYLNEIMLKPYNDKKLKRL